MSQQPTTTPLDQFLALAKRVIAPPRAEIDRREVKYRATRKTKHEAAFKLQNNIELLRGRINKGVCAFDESEREGLEALRNEIGFWITLEELPPRDEGGREWPQHRIRIVFSEQD